MVAEAIENRGQVLTDWVPATPDNGESNEPKPTATIVHDLRPQGDQGNSAGAEARQRARIKHLEKMGAGILMDEAVTGRVVVITESNGGYNFNLALAGEKVPEREMVPGAAVDLGRTFTTFIPTDVKWSVKPAKTDR
jgi:hypothetical protein